MYSKTVMDHFAHPRNVGIIDNADGFARIKSSVHDDLIDLYIRVEDGHIAEIKYRTFGCAAAIAASSMASELAQGLTLAEAANLTEEHVVQALDGLPESKRQCSVLLPQALRAALEDYYRKHPEARIESAAD
ncbi:MAG: iron-sulfur cluster assembly scaffold protein [Anaerolineae bacterium]